MRPDKPTFNTESGTKFHVCIFAVVFFFFFSISFGIEVDSPKGTFHVQYFPLCFEVAEEPSWGCETINLCPQDIRFLLFWVDFYIVYFFPHSMIFNISYFVFFLTFPKLHSW